jgi:hypothetical protein
VAVFVAPKKDSAWCVGLPLVREQDVLVRAYLITAGVGSPKRGLSLSSPGFVLSLVREQDVLVQTYLTTLRVAQERVGRNSERQGLGQPREGCR